ncbi:MAG: PhzF family phenazine biosynthesis protein [Vicinamibacterales bacterium]
MRLPFHTLDVFTTRRYAGNPLAVVLEADGLSDAQMQQVAREFNLSETIFVQAPEDAAHTAKVRIFFPNGEIPFAGHPTIGCAILLATLGRAPDDPLDVTITLEERAGLVPVQVTLRDGHPHAMFTAPVVPVEVPAPGVDAAFVARALGLSPSDIGFDGHAPRAFEGGPRFLHLPLATRDALVRARPIEPHWSALVDAVGTDAGYCYTRGGDHPDTAYRARMFAPSALTPEDPATGSATALLAAQLLISEAPGDGTHRWRLEQGYEMARPSDLVLEADVAGGRLTAVRVAGHAVPVMSGHVAI